MKDFSKIYIYKENESLGVLESINGSVETNEKKLKIFVKIEIILRRY